MDKISGKSRYKICNKCGLEKLGSDFYPTYNYCKTCKNKQVVERRKKRWKEDPEAHVLYRKKNVERLRETYRLDPAKFREYRKRYLSNPNARRKHNIANRRWNKSLKGKNYRNWYWEKVRQKNSIPYKIRLEVIERDQVCQLCGSDQRLEFDHIYPVSLKSYMVEKVENLQLLCRSCNAFKCNNLMLPEGGMMKTRKLVLSGGCDN